jgi:hypothetical protein
MSMPLEMIFPQWWRKMAIQVETIGFAVLVLPR